jgi:hypothetical protein
MKLIKTLVALILLTLTLVACGSSQANTGTAVTPTPTTSAQQQQPAPTPKPSHFAVSQVVSVGNTWQLTVLSATNGGTATYLKAGQVFLVLQVKATNISSSEQTMSSLGNWSVRDVDGNTYQAGYSADSGPALDGKVEAGQPLKGSLTFVVKGAVHHYLLLFQESFSEQGQVIWDISV